MEKTYSDGLRHFDVSKIFASTNFKKVGKFIKKFGIGNLDIEIPREGGYSYEKVKGAPVFFTVRFPSIGRYFYIDTPDRLKAVLKTDLSDESLKKVYFSFCPDDRFVPRFVCVSDDDSMPI